MAHKALRMADQRALSVGQVEAESDRPLPVFLRLSANQGPLPRVCDFRGGLPVLPLRGHLSADESRSERAARLDYGREWRDLQRGARQRKYELVESRSE